MSSVTTCGGCKANAVVIEQLSSPNPGQWMRRARCKACGRCSPWKLPEDYSGLVNEAWALMYEAPQGASK